MSSVPLCDGKYKFPGMVLNCIPKVGACGNFTHTSQGLWNKRSKQYFKKYFSQFVPLLLFDQLW